MYKIMPQLKKNIKQFLIGFIDFYKEIITVLEDLLM